MATESVTNLWVVYSHNRNVKPPALLGGCHVGQSHCLLQFLHGRAELYPTQGCLWAKASFQSQTKRALSQGIPTVPQRLWWKNNKLGWRYKVVVRQWFRNTCRIKWNDNMKSTCRWENNECILRLGWDTISSTSSGLLCKMAAASLNVTPSKLVLLREMRRPPEKNQIIIINYLF